MLLTVARYIVGVYCALIVKVSPYAAVSKWYLFHSKLTRFDLFAMVSESQSAGRVLIYIFSFSPVLKLPDVGVTNEDQCIYYHPPQASSR